MNSVERFFSAHKIIFILFSILSLPFVLAWSLLYGIIVGSIGITVDRYEHMRDNIRSHVISILKYPKWQAEKWKASALRSMEILSLAEEQKRERKRAIEEGRERAPGMLNYIVTDIIIFGILPYPFFLVWGIIAGPVRALLNYSKWWYLDWKKYKKGGVPCNLIRNFLHFVNLTTICFLHI